MDTVQDTLTPRIDRAPWLAQYRFTAETARANALRAAQARELRQAGRKRASALETESREQVRADLLLSVRDQLRRVNGLIRKETDGRKLTALLQAQALLARQLLDLEPAAPSSAAAPVQSRSSGKSVRQD